MATRLVSQRLWLVFGLLVLACLALPAAAGLLADYVCSESAISAFHAWQTGSALYAYLTQGGAWLGLVLLGAPPFYAMTLRFLLANLEDIREMVRKHNEQIRKNTGIPEDPGKATSDGSPWHAAINTMANWQWWVMLGGFLIAVTAGAANMVVTGYILGCS